MGRGMNECVELYKHSHIEFLYSFPPNGNSHTHIQKYRNEKKIESFQFQHSFPNLLQKTPQRLTMCSGITNVSVDGIPSGQLV